MQLIYRGSSFTFQPSSIASIQSCVTTARTLLYRGHTYHYSMPTLRCDRTPQAVNWRFSAPCSSQGGQLQPSHS